MRPPNISRRNILRSGAALAGAGTVVGYPLLSAEPALAASLSGWEASDISIESSDGTISDVYVADGTGTYTIEWSGMETPQTVTVTVEGRLADGGSYETLSTGEFTIDSASGSVDESTISWDVNPFPFSFITDHSNISTADFENPDDGTTKTTALDVRITFDSAEETVSHEAQFAVDVTNTASATVIDDFEDGDLAEWTLVSGDTSGGDYAQTQTGTVHEGSTAVEVHNDPSGDTPAIKSTPGDGLPTYPTETSKVEFYYNFDNASVGIGHLQLMDDAAGMTVRVHFDANSNEWWLGFYDGSSWAKSTTSIDVGAYANTWTRVVIDMSVRPIEAYWYDLSDNLLASGSVAADSTFSGDLSVRLHAQGHSDNSASSFYDNIHIV